MAIRLRTKKLIYSGLAGAGIALILSSGGGYFFYKATQEREHELKEQYKAEIEELKAAALQNNVVYTLKSKVEKGTRITEDMLQSAYVPASAAPTDFILATLIEEDQEIFAKTDLAEGTTLTHSIVYENEDITKDMREGEYSFIELPSNIKEDEYIDIRIQFPTGDDFVLLSKKRVKDVLGLTVWFDVDEGEILTMSSAIVDAYIEGAKIYGMRYVDSHMQDKSLMTYPVKQNVRELITESPNIVNKAKLNLELQNRARVEENLSSIETTDKEQIRNGEAATQNKVDRENEKISAEERVNALNEATQTEAQQNLIGGGNE